MTTAADGKKYRIKHYNLDAIISVGYRVNSIKGAQFRKWATGILRQYLVQGYALNERRLCESARQLADLKRLVQLQSEVAANQELTSNQSQALLRVLGDYARALDVLDQYNHQHRAPEQLGKNAPPSLLWLTYRSNHAAPRCVTYAPPYSLVNHEHIWF